MKTPCTINGERGIMLNVQSSMKTIPLTKGYSAIVDDEDFEKVSIVRWQSSIGQSGNNYPLHNFGKHKKPKFISLHRFLMNAKKGQIIDHINHNTLDNRKCNLRICTRSNNAMNMRKPKKSNSLSKYKGLSWNVKLNKWTVRVMKDYKNYYFGLFISEKDAAIEYNKRAIELFGKFAKLNEFDD